MERYEEREQVEFENQGEKIFGVFHRPLGVERPPVILFCHGLAGHKIGEHRQYVYLAEAFSRAGLASLRIDFRGSGDSEGEFSEMSLKGEVSDALLALEFLKESPLIDKERIGVYARSFGSAVGVIAAATFGSVKSIALWAPIFDGHQWEEVWEQQLSGVMDEEKRHELMRINGQMPSLEFYGELFGMKLGEEMQKLLDVPLLLIHGEKDPVIRIDHSEMYIQARERAKGKTELMRIPHSDHDFSHPEEKQLAIRKTCEWFKETLVLEK